MISDTKEKLYKKLNKPVEEISDSEVKAILRHGEMVDTLTDEHWDNILR